MIESEPRQVETLKTGDVLTHYTGGAYRFLDTLTNASGYEKNGTSVLVPMGTYEQLYDGDLPAGTRYVRPMDEILHGTVDVDGEEVRIFRISPVDSPQNS